MKKVNIIFIILVLTTFIFSSCTKMLYTSLDILRPAKTSFSTDVKNLLIVNNSVLQPYEYGHHTELLDEKPKNVKIKADSLAIFCLGALTEELEGKNFFNTIQLIPNTVNRGSDFTRISQLTKDEIKQLCLKYNTEAILSLDKIKVKDDLAEFYLESTSSYLASLEVKYETNWSINYPDEKTTTSIRFNDTIYWERESYIRKKTINSLPDRSNALIDAALFVGQKSVNRFVPYWDKVDRYFYNPNKKLAKQGMEAVYSKKWKTAVDLWIKATEKYKSPFIQFQLLNNIAVGYEIVGDIDKALEYSAQSFEALSQLTFVNYTALTNIIEYNNNLRQRKKEIDVLKTQLGE